MSTPAPSETPHSSAPETIRDAWSRLKRWCREEPVSVGLLLALIVTIASFYVLYQPLSGGTKSFGRWAYEAWNSENDLEHGALILPGAILVAWLGRREFAAAVKKPSAWGLLPIGAGLFLFLVATWTLQPRLALVALPLLVFGSVWFLWGWPTARVASFACGLLLFMVPIGFLLSRTVPLQLLVAKVVAGMANLFGVGVARQGMDLLALDGSFQCQVAGGCSGIRSIMAMTMLSLLYVHFYERVLWKKVLVFGVTILLAIPGNVVRVFTIVLASKWFGQEVGTGPWHDISGFIVTLPIAVGGMLLFSDLLNRDWSGVRERVHKPEREASTDPVAAPAALESKKSAPAAPSSPISYDY